MSSSKSVWQLPLPLSNSVTISSIVRPPFVILTDHAPLQWLSAQKMEGLLCRWALALQEYDFTIKYRKGVQNSNADALSRYSAAIVVPGIDKEMLKVAQENDPVLKEVLICFIQTSGMQKKNLHNGSSNHALGRYFQLYDHNCWNNGWNNSMHVSGMLQDQLTRRLPLIPLSRQYHSCHDAPSSGHQGVDQTLYSKAASGSVCAYILGWYIYIWHDDSYRKCINCQQANSLHQFVIL